MKMATLNLFLKIRKNQLKEAKKRLSEISKENDELKMLLKKLELTVLRDLRDNDNH